VQDEEEEMQLAETLKLLQGKVPKLNVDVTHHLYNSNNNTGSVRYNNDFAESQIKHFSFSERLEGFAVQNVNNHNEVIDTNDNV